MNKKERNKKIKKLKKQGLKLQEIGNLFGITKERVRQLFLPKPKLKYCRKHKRRFLQTCWVCENNKKTEKIFKKFLKDKKINLDSLRKIFDSSRKKELVFLKSKLVKMLIDNYGLNYNKIARIFHKDHTTIINLYKKKL